jgi:hypothetical protein
MALFDPSLSLGDIAEQHDFRAAFYRHVPSRDKQGPRSLAILAVKHLAVRSALHLAEVSRRFAAD